MPVHIFPVQAPIASSKTVVQSMEEGTKVQRKAVAKQLARADLFRSLGLYLKDATGLSAGIFVSDDEPPTSQSPAVSVQLALGSILWGSGVLGGAGRLCDRKPGTGAVVEAGY